MGNKIVECTCGAYEIDENGNIVSYIGGDTENGMCFKNEIAWKKGEGVIYISEVDLEDLTNFNDLWTKDSWISYIKEYIPNEYKDNDNFILYIAEMLFNLADYQDLSTLFIEYDDDTWFSAVYEEFLLSF